MCYITLSLLISWCLNLDEDKRKKKQEKGPNVISSMLKFFFRWLPMAYIFPLCARTLHAYFHEYLMTTYLENHRDEVLKEGHNGEVR